MALRVLLVDDEAAYVEALSRALRLRGFAVRTAADGASARALLAVEAADVVVLDLNMPRADGMQALAALRAADPSLPVLVLCADGQAELAGEALGRGAIDCLTKPCSVETLADAIEEAHERSTAARAVARVADKRLN